ncbi:zinc finger protein 594-like [Toxorhynchites rutilus septentrionalis]|uniref:zinc finger protein 594-like n=1 Tax=Toxorhynchites rutilus septentrionalis TaxID=329112 RepID=UPI002478478D|nr:zinc finger protein 594-like [Toxorhynchites rutilus septentrionalis]
MDGWCRVCSRNDDFRRFPLFAVAEVSQEVIANMITSCTDTQVSSEDGLPQQICPDCLIALSLSFSFRKLCRRSDAKFRESYDGRTLLQPQDSHARRSQSQVNDDNTFDIVPTIKEEVEFYDYECSLPPQEDQWVIQNPRTIGEGAMTVVHSTGQYYDEADDNGDQDASVVVPMVTHDPSVFGECSGIGRKEEKWKKKPQTPERFSKRIRRQDSPISSEQIAAEKQLYELNPNWNSANTEPVVAANTGSVTNPNPVQQRCEYCKKKMKKSYKHRNGKCLAPKGKNASRPRCVYCQMSFVRSTNISTHLRNSCRVYRQLCNQKRIEALDASHQSTVSTILPSNDVMRDGASSPMQTDSHPETTDQKPILRKPQTKKLTRSKCQYCKLSFSKRGNLINHQRERCKILKERNKIEPLETSGTNVESAWEDIVPEQPRQLRRSQDIRASTEKKLQTDKPQTEKTEPTIEAATKCVYCTQKVSKKTRFQHHNGRCVLGRANAEHPCAYCPMAFSSRSNLLRHQRERCQPYREEHDIPTECGTKDSTVGSEDRQNESTKKPQPISETKREPIDEKPTVKSSKVRRPFYRHRRQRIKDSERSKLKETRRIRHSLADNNQTLEYSCGYCRKSFTIRDELLEHQRSCNVRKLHKQVKCQHCGVTISNRGNLRKHQRLYCKRIPRSDGIKAEKMEEGEEEESPKKQKIVKKISKQEKLNDSEVNIGKPAEIDNKSSEEQAGGGANSVAELTNFNHPCEYCKRPFKSEDRAQTHSRKCIVKRSMNQFNCNLCSERFSSRSNLYRHQRVRCKPRNKTKTHSILENCVKFEPILSTKPERKTQKADPDDQSVFFKPLLEPDSNAITRQSLDRKTDVGTDKDEGILSDERQAHMDQDQATRQCLDQEKDDRIEEDEYVFPEEEQHPSDQSPVEETQPEPNLQHNNNAEDIKEPDIQIGAERGLTVDERKEDNKPLVNKEELAEEILPDGVQEREEVLHEPIIAAETDKV